MTRRLLYLLLLFVFACVLLFVPLPIAPTYAGRTFENAGHTPLFFLVTMGVMVAMRDHPRFRGARLYVYAGLIGVGAGLLSEIIQKPLARDASWEDVLADAVGAILALAVYALFDRRARLSLWQRLAALAVALSCVAIFLTPIVRMVYAYVHRNAQFPVIADFHSGIEKQWTLSFGVNREIVDNALEVDLFADEFPGVSFHEPVPDWRRYRTLIIDVANPASETLYLGVRVHDLRHNFNFKDRFNRRYDLSAGERRTLRIALDDIRHGPRQRLMDMAHISDITLFRGENSGSRRLRVYSIRLE